MTLEQLAWKWSDCLFNVMSGMLWVFLKFMEGLWTNVSMEFRQSMHMKFSLFSDCSWPFKWNEFLCSASAACYERRIKSGPILVIRRARVLHAFIIWRQSSELCDDLKLAISYRLNLRRGVLQHKKAHADVKEELALRESMRGLLTRLACKIVLF